MDTIRIGGVPEHFNYPWKLGIKNNLFNVEGIQLNWKDFHGGTGEMSQALEENQIDVAIMLTEGSIKQIADQKPFKILQKYVETPLFWGIYVNAQSNKNSIEDLKNDKVGISRYGSGSHLMAYINAKNQDWNYEDLQFIVASNLEGLQNSLANHTSDYFMWEHFTTKPLVDQGELKHIQDVPTPWPCFVIVTSSKFHDKNKTLLNNLLKVINQITSTIKMKESLALEIATSYNQQVEDVKKWLAQTEWSQNQLKESEFKRVNNELVNLNLIDSKLSYRNI
ncbi:MAG: substrate-binding domain-containing protein [Flavobacteriaceae bacterium]|nr:substrate-binding domain-containing protein [Flavobacteriaceae bacterium]